MPTSSKPRLGILFALITACGLGAITTQAKLFYAADGNALTLMLARFVASTLVFGLFLLLRNASFKVDRRQRLPLASLGIVWSAAMICYLLAVETISVSLAVLILYFYPLLVLAYSVLRGQLKASIRLCALFCAAFAGLYLALAGGAITVNPGGVMFAALASCGAAFTFVCGARVAPNMSPLLVTFWVNAAGLLIILPLTFGKLAWPGTTVGTVALCLATLLYLVAILSQFEALARLSAARAAFLLNLEPVVSIILASLVLGETLSLVQVSGVIVVIAVVILSLRINPQSA
ncbi:MAG TPA: DMT family transporter [Gammaproteobacteria bacterium]|nr:DMT family transporter [Gammaproteobacteria bacterium]